MAGFHISSPFENFWKILKDYDEIKFNAFEMFRFNVIGIIFSIKYLKIIPKFSIIFEDSSVLEI